MPNEFVRTFGFDPALVIWALTLNMRETKDKASSVILLFAVAVIVAAIVALWYFAAPKEGDSSAAASPLDAFARCLAEKRVTMYGASWCPHCLDQKNDFGSSFQYVPYVECSTNPKACVDAGVDATPTWILGDGTRLIGRQPLEALSAAAGCPLP